MESEGGRDGHRAAAMSEAGVALQARLRAEGRLTLKIRVIPKSQRSEWAGQMGDGTWKLKLAAVPEKGKANEALVRFLAGELGVARGAVEIVAGASSQNKLVRICL